MPEFKLGEKVKHWDGDIGEVVKINKNEMYVIYPKGSRSFSKADGLVMGGPDKTLRVHYKLTKLEKALA